MAPASEGVLWELAEKLCLREKLASGWQYAPAIPGSACRSGFRARPPKVARSSPNRSLVKSREHGGLDCSLLRALEKVNSEWTLMVITHNMGKLHCTEQRLRQPKGEGAKGPLRVWQSIHHDPACTEPGSQLPAHPSPPAQQGMLRSRLQIF